MPGNPPGLTWKLIQEARERIAGKVGLTPVLTSATLDAQAGAQLHFKCENFQKCGAFKARGATNAVFALSESQARRGVATHSSGNHAAALGTDLATYTLITKHVLYLRFWSSITRHFWEENSAKVTKAYEGHGAVPNYRSGSRSDVLKAIQSFSGDKNSDGFLLLTQILRDLDPAKIPDHWY